VLYCAGPDSDPEKDNDRKKGVPLQGTPRGTLASTSTLRQQDRLTSGPERLGDVRFAARAGATQFAASHESFPAPASTVYSLASLHGFVGALSATESPTGNVDLPQGLAFLVGAPGESLDVNVRASW
jgi:hypothetical protein